MQRQPQGRSRRPGRGGKLAQHESGAVVVVRGELEPAQPLAAQARRQPGEHRADVAALQGLLERPEAVAAGDHPGPRVDDEELLDVEAEPGQCPGRQVGRRVEDHHQPPGPLRRDQRRREQADLADARMRQQQFAQDPARPAAAGQLGVERGEAAGHGVRGAATQLMTEPQGRMQGFGGAPVEHGQRPRAQAARRRPMQGC